MKENFSNTVPHLARHRPGSRRNFVKAASAFAGSIFMGPSLARAAFASAHNSADTHALVQFEPGGRITVAYTAPHSNTADCTVMARIAAATLNLRVELIDAGPGDPVPAKNLPADEPQRAANLIPLVQTAATQAREKLLTAAIEDTGSPLYGAQPDQLDFKYGRIIRHGEPDSGESFTALLARNGNRPLGAMASQRAAL